MRQLRVFAVTDTRGTQAGEPTAGELELAVLRSRAELDAVRAASDDRRAYEEAVCALLPREGEWTLPGVCQVCAQPVAFAGDWLFSDGVRPNWRERLVCPHCGLNNRQRFTAQLTRELLRRASGRRAVYLYEQVTHFYLWAERDLPHDVVGSEYLGHEYASGTVVDGIRHEDATALSFADRSLDLIVSTDVYEHVPDIEATLAEAARVLRPGGTLLFSVPFWDSRDTTERRAALENGEVVELLEPQYHGNPISAGGSLVFFDYGWDLLDMCSAAGFDDPRALAYWSSTYGYLGNGYQLVFVADRAG